MDEIILNGDDDLCMDSPAENTFVDQVAKEFGGKVYDESKIRQQRLNFIGSKDKNDQNVLRPKGFFCLFLTEDRIALLF